MRKPVPRRKDDRRQEDVPASVLGAFLPEDRRKSAERRRKSDAAARPRPKGR